MKPSRLYHMIRAELRRVFVQPWFWLAIPIIALIKFAQTFCTEQFNEIFVLHRKVWSVLRLYTTDHNTFLTYVAFCLCVFPVAGNFVQDYKSNRLSSLLLRSSYLEYAFTQVIVTVIISSLCMFLGDCICIITGCVGLKLPFATDYIMGIYAEGQNDLLATGHPYLYFFFWELRYCSQVAFFAELTLLVSIFVRDAQFIVIFPMIAKYFFWYFLVAPTKILIDFPHIVFFTPVSIYDYTTLLFGSNDVLSGLYAVFFTCLVGVLIAFALNAFLIRWRR